MRLAYDNWLKVEQFEYKDELYDKLHVFDGVAGLVVDKNNKVLLVKQFRPCINKYTLEIVAGCLDKKMSEENILIEEMNEEAHIKKKDIKKLEKIHSYNMIIGSSDAKLHIYYIKLDIKGKNMTIDDDRDVEEIKWVKLDELEDLIENQKVTDGKTIMAYQWLKIKTMGDGGFNV